MLSPHRRFPILQRRESPWSLCSSVIFGRLLVCLFVSLGSLKPNWSSRGGPSPANRDRPGMPQKIPLQNIPNAFQHRYMIRLVTGCNYNFSNKSFLPFHDLTSSFTYTVPVKNKGTSTLPSLCSTLFLQELYRE
jgi:hypothetical protein